MNGRSSPQATARFLDVRFDLIEEDHAVEFVLGLAAAPTFSYVVTPNVDHLVRLHRECDNPRLWLTYEGAALSLCDSQILRVLARLSGLTLPLVPGSNLTARLLEKASKLHSVAVVGGSAQLIGDLRSLYPEVTWIHHAPPHGLLYNAEAQVKVAEFVERCSAPLTFFAVGSPQSELICASIQGGQQARGAVLCVGASLEFLTGAKTRAPRWMQIAGLEWLFRLASEPGRLWRRYLVEGPRIFGIWWRWRIRTSR